MSSEQLLHVKDPPCDTQVFAFTSSRQVGSDDVDTVMDVVIVTDVALGAGVGIGVGAGVGTGVA